MTPLSRSILSAGRLGNIATIKLNKTSQYLQLQGSTSRLNIGTNTLAFSTRIFWGISENTIIASKYDSSVGGNDGYLISLDSAGIIESTFRNGGQDAKYRTPTDMSVGWHHITFYWERIDLNTPPKIYIDAVENTDGFLFSNTTDPTNADITSTISFKIGGFQASSSFVYAQSGVFPGIVIGQPLTQADATFLHNDGNVICWPKVESDNLTLYNKFNEAFDLGSFDGSTELDALTGKVNGWVLTNVNSAPFTRAGLVVDCI